MKLTQDLLHKVKQIEISTRRLLRGSMMGEHHSTQKGSGIEFDQLREYVMGDDVRFIDWKTSARLGTLAVKEYIEERNRTIMLLIDKSASTLYSSQDLLKSDIIAQVASALAIVAECSRDYCGAILFNDTIIKTIPPQRSRSHTHHLMEEIFVIEPSGKTDFATACNKLLLLQKKDAIVFIISDFWGDLEKRKALKIMAQHHEVIAIHCVDKREMNMHFGAQIMCQDPETGAHVFVSGYNARYNELCKEKIESIHTFFKNSGIDFLTLENDQDFIGEIIRFFRKKMR